MKRTICPFCGGQKWCDSERCLACFLATNRRRPAEDRFWPKVQKTEGCWLWTGALAKGYGRFSVTPTTVTFAHRYAYELIVGTIPHGLQIDHLCRNTRCVNPQHLEPVTARANTLRGIAPSARNAAKSECIRGHAFTPANTYIKANGHRNCRKCHVLEVAAARRRRKLVSAYGGSSV